jgi:hypothetical protein
MEAAMEEVPVLDASRDLTSTELPPDWFREEECGG